MTTESVHRIVEQGLFPGPGAGATLLETHISWVILTPEFAFKIKKPLRFDFLDFSSLAQRAHCCHEELRLNRRLAPEMYLRVLPIGPGGIGDDSGPALDYALQMRRMDNDFEMDKRLKTNAVTTADMECLAFLLATFHRQHRLRDLPPYDPAEDAADFADLFHFEADLADVATPGQAALLKTWARQVPQFLQRHQQRLHARQQAGFWVDGHGDLHSRNIFLPPNTRPVVFDCIEFSPHFRRLDVLNELAFLAMDLDFYGHGALADHFLKAYQRHWACFENQEDWLIFQYFKAYRANVRLKVALLELRQHPSPTLRQTALAYWALLRRYADVVG
jgi:hypothetical protein